MVHRSYSFNNIILPKKYWDSLGGYMSYEKHDIGRDENRKMEYIRPLPDAKQREAKLPLSFYFQVFKDVAKKHQIKVDKEFLPKKKKIIKKVVKAEPKVVKPRKKKIVKAEPKVVKPRKKKIVKADKPKPRKKKIVKKKNVPVKYNAYSN